MPNDEQRAKKKIVFLAHWVESWNWLLNYVHELHRYPQHARGYWLLAPVCWLMSLWYLIGTKTHGQVDRFNVHGSQGEIWLIRNFGWHFVAKIWKFPLFHGLIRRRIKAAVLDAQAQGATVIGLGALTKAEWLTAGGKWIVDNLGSWLTVPIVHGDTLTAAVVIKQAEKLIELYGLEGSPVFVTGATSKIGRAIVLALAEKRIRVVMYSASAQRVDDIRLEAGESKQFIHHATSYEQGQDAKLWITGKAEKGAGEKIIAALPEQAVALNFSVPDPLSPDLLLHRPDIRHFDGGLMGYDHLRMPIRFTMRLTYGVTYACHAGTMVHGLEGWTHHEVGVVDMQQIWHVWDCALKHGFRLPSWTSHLRPVSVLEQQVPHDADVIELPRHRAVG